MALDYFRDMQPEGDLPPPAFPERLVFALDHYGAPSGEQALRLQDRARSYAQAHGLCVFEVGEGIGHQLMLERGRVLPGQLVVGADFRMRSAMARSTRLAPVSARPISPASSSADSSG